MSEHKLKQANLKQKGQNQLGFVGRMLAYDPYKVFDSRKGCIAAVALCIAIIAVTILNGLINKSWLSIVFVPLYLLIIRNRLKKLRNMA